MTIVAGAPVNLSAQAGTALLGFEAADQRGAPAGWALSDPQRLVLDTVERFVGRVALRSQLASPSAVAGTPPPVNIGRVALPVSFARGRAIRVTGYIRTADVAGYAGLWARIDAFQRPGLAFDNMRNRGARGTTPWAQYVVELPVDSGATNVELGVIHSGSGTAWFDSVVVEAVGPPRPRQVPDYDSAAVARAQRRESDSVSAWLSSAMVPLGAASPRPDHTDLMPLARAIGEARVVGLGEATHGTREFFELKHRIIRMLVHERGFNIVALEAARFEVEALNRYVQTGAGDPDHLLASTYFWTWNTHEVRALIDWMRSYNAQRADTAKLRLVGLDIQYPSHPTKALIAYLRRVDAPLATEAAQRLSLLGNPITAPEFARASDSTKRAVAAFMALVGERLIERRAVFSQRASAPAWQRAREHATTVSQFVQMWLVSTRAPLVRDSVMAANAAALVAPPGGRNKVAVWAHNSHVAFADASQMGYYLRRHASTAYFALGLLFNRGTFRAVEALPDGSLGALRVFSVPAARIGSLEAAFAGAQHPIGFLDLRTVAGSGGTAERWLSTPRIHRTVGSVYADQFAASFEVPIALRSAFDAVVYVDQATASQGTSGSARSALLSLPAPANLGFEESSAQGWPPQWVFPPHLPQLGFQARIDRVRPWAGAASATLERGPQFSQANDAVGNLLQHVDAIPYRGSRVRVTVHARRNGDRTAGAAYIRVQAERHNQPVPVFDNLTAAPVLSSAWRPYVVEVIVPRDADRLSFGVSVIGSASVSIDGISIQPLPPR